MCCASLTDGCAGKTEIRAVQTHTDLRTAALRGNYGRIVAGHDQCAVRQLQIPGIPVTAAISALCQPLPTQRGKSNISCFAVFHATKRGGQLYETR